jgi:hypothetical protein
VSTQAIPLSAVFTHAQLNPAASQPNWGAVVQVQPEAGLQTSPGGHATAVPPVQAPAWQVSPVVQASPSLHGMFDSGVCTHWPVAGSQAALWHWSWGVQTTAVPGTQTPVWQVSFWVQRLLSALQAVPDSGVCTHWPVAGSQAALWHWSWGVQTTAVPAQLPSLWQMSLTVQRLPSVQLVPTAFGFGCEPQTPAVQVRRWHWTWGHLLPQEPQLSTSLW